jgi:uncharacterized alpha-E superfamily protein
MAEDWLFELMGAVDRAGKHACTQIWRALEELEVSRDARGSGASLVDVVDQLMSRGGRELRLGAADAFNDYERAVATLRAAVVRSLVDDEGWTLSDAGTRLGISRQAAARLYAAAHAT